MDGKIGEQMKPGMGGRKGSAFERKISKDLSLWWSDNVRNDLFWRTHSSGQLGTCSKKMSEYGDIMAIDDLGAPFTKAFHLELRHGKCIKIHDIVYKPKPSNSNMTGFIREGFAGAKASNRNPLWIFREQGQRIMVLMSAWLFIHYSYGISGFCGRADDKFYDWMLRTKGVYIYIPEHDLVLLDYENFKGSINKSKLLQEVKDGTVPKV